MSVNNTTISALLKEFYTPLKAEMGYRKFPLLAMAAKKTDLGGKKWIVPVIHEEIAGSSANFAQAQTNAGNTSLQNVAFEVTPVQLYDLAQVDGLTIASTRNDAQSYIRALKRSIDSKFMNLTRVIGQAIYRSKWGNLGNIGVITTDTITLSTPSDIHAFAKGDAVVLAATQATSALRASTASTIITRIDYNNGTISFASNVTVIWPAAIVGDFIFRIGDREDSPTPTARLISGLEDWLPVVEPTVADSFFGVNRSVSSRLGGSRYTSSTSSVRDTLMQLATRIQVNGGTPDVVFLNPENFNDLVIELGPQIRYVDVKAGTRAQFGFEAVMLGTPAGVVRCIPDRDCPKGKCYMLQMDTLTLGSAGGAPRLLDDDGNDVLRQAAADGVEVRVGAYPQLYICAPGWNGVGVIPTT